jgi:tetratricopeptide (TPR) repeat protein
MNAAHMKKRTRPLPGSFGGLLAAMLLISCSGAASAGPFEDGLRLYEANRRQEAIRYFELAVVGDPKRKEAWLFRGRAYGETNNDAEAIRSYESALRLDPCYAEAFFQRGRIYLWNRKPEQAIAQFGNAIRCDARVAKYYLQRASVHHQSFVPDMLGSQIHYKAAIADYAEAIRLEPGSWNAFAARCAFNYDFLRYGDALEDCDKAIRLNAKDAGLYANRAAILHALGRPRESQADAARAIALDPAMRTFINRTIQSHDSAEAARRRMLQEFRAGAGGGRDSCSSYSGGAQQACRSHDMNAASRMRSGAATRDDQQKYGR